MRVPQPLLAGILGMKLPSFPMSPARWRIFRLNSHSKPILFTKEIWIFKTTPILCSEKKTGAPKNDEAKTLPKRLVSQATSSSGRTGESCKWFGPAMERLKPQNQRCKKRVTYMGASKNRGGKTPQIIHLNRLFHDFHHPFWGVKTPIFGNTHIVSCFFWLMQDTNCWV